MNKYSNLIGQLEVHYFIYGPPRGLTSRSNVARVKKDTQCNSGLIPRPNVMVTVTIF